MALNRTPDAVIAGVGYPWYADASSAEEAAPSTAPADPSTDPAGNWEGFGYTDDGTSFEWDLTYEDIEVAEEPQPIRSLWTAVEYRLAMVLAQFEARTLQVALNGGTITAIPGPPVEQTYEPPTIGGDHPWSVLFQFTNENGFGSYLYIPTAKNTAAAAIPFAEAPQKAVIGVEMKVGTPSSGAAWTLRDYISAS